jgi:hypothetical protein
MIDLTLLSTSQDLLMFDSKMIDLTLLSTSQDLLMFDSNLVKSLDKANALSSLLTILERALAATFFFPLQIQFYNQNQSLIV